MKKQGFTLVELLAVIVILGLIALVSVPAITGMIKSGKEDLAESQKDTIEMAAKNWASDEANVMKLPKDNGSICVLLSALQSAGYVDLDLKNPKTGKAYPGTVKVTIKREGKRLIYTVDLDNTSTLNCIQ